MTSKFKKSLLLFMLFATVSKSAMAGALDVAFVNSINGMTNGWISPLLQVGASIGVSLWFIESLCKIKFERLYQNMDDLLTFAFKRSIIFGVLTAIFLKFDLYQDITLLFLNVAQKISGISVTSSGLGLEPGDIWQQYATWYTNDYAPLINTLGITNIGGQLSMAIFCAFFFAATLWICFEMILLNVKYSVTLFGGIIFAGCWGSSWVKEYWHKYVGALIGISFQVLVFCLIYAAYKNTLNYSGLKNLATNGIVSTNFLLQIISTSIAALCLHFVPGWLGGIFFGVSGGMGASDIIRSAQNVISSVANNYLNKSPGGSPSSNDGTSFGHSGSGGGIQAPVNNSDKASHLK